MNIQLLPIQGYGEVVKQDLASTTAWSMLIVPLFHIHALITPDLPAETKRCLGFPDFSDSLFSGTYNEQIIFEVPN